MNTHRFIHAAPAIVIAAGLIAFGIVATSLPSEEQVMGQSSDRACAEPPVEPRNVELWEHDSGILVQWDVCPNHNYEIRWRRTTDTVDDPFNWPDTTSAGRSGQFDIPYDTTDSDNPDYVDPNDATPLQNGQRYVVQLRPIHSENNRIDRGPWTDDFFAEPRYCGDLPEIPSDIRVAAGDSKLTVAWNRCSDTTSHIRWRAVVGGIAESWSDHVDVGEARTHDIEDLENGAHYDVQVRSALRSSDRITTPDGDPYRTAWSDPVSGSPTSACPEGGPVVPKDFVVVPGNEKLFVSWRPCPDHDYELAYRSRGLTLDPNWPTTGDWADVDADGHSINNLENSTRYEVRLRSVRDGNPSAETGSYVASPQYPPDNNRSPGWKNVPRELKLIENRNYDNPIATIAAADPDRRDEIRYRIVPPFPRPEIFPFAINTRDGDIYLYDKLDYEVIEEYELTVQATDTAGAEITQVISIEVIDAEGPPPPILRQVCSTTDGVKVSWSGNKSTRSFQLQYRSLSAVSFPKRNLIELDTTSFTTSSLNENSAYVFRVRAIDRLTKEQSKWSSEEAVYVGDVANSAPKFRQDEWTFDIAEEQPSGVHVGSVIANDEDRYSSLQFKILDSTPEDAPFAVDSFTGAITTTERLDFETQNSYSLVIGASDLCGSTDYADVAITVIDDPNIDAMPLIPNAPAIIAKHEQVIVLWPTNYEDAYDLDWRKVNEDYLSRPEDTDATMPRIVDLPDQDSAYAFRLRRVNRLGEVGDWSDETIIDPNIPSPSIEPIDVPRQGQVLGGVELYIPGMTLKTGQTARLGFNMFGVDGMLDNSLIDRRDATAFWRISDGELSDDSTRVVHYTAPEQEGVYDISILVKQTVPGGIVQHNLEMVIHVIGDNRLIKPYQSGDEVPRNFEVDGVTYGAISYLEAKEYRPPEAPKALFKVREKSIPSFEWIGVHIAPGDDASTLQPRLDGYTAVGDIFTSQFVAKDGTPIINMSFTSTVAMCLPVPEDWTHLLQSLHVMRLTPRDEQILLDLPVRFQPDPTFNDPALVCGHSTLFDGQLFLAILDGDIVIPTPTPTVPPTPTETPAPSPTVKPTVAPTDTPTATSTPDTSSVVVVSTSTHTPTPTIVPSTATFTPTVTATHTPAPTDTPPPTDTTAPTDTPTPVPTSTEVPTVPPTATLVPTETPAPSPTLEPTVTMTTTAVPNEPPTATSTPTDTPTPTPEPTHTPIPTVVQATSTPPPPASEPEEPVLPPDEEENQEFGTSPLIIVVLIAFLIVGAAAMLYSNYNNRVKRQLASAPESDEAPHEADESAKPGDRADEAADEHDDGRYDRLRYDG